MPRKRCSLNPNDCTSQLLFDMPLTRLNAKERMMLPLSGSSLTSLLVSRTKQLAFRLSYMFFHTTVVSHHSAKNGSSSRFEPFSYSFGSIQSAQRSPGVNGHFRVSISNEKIVKRMRLGAPVIPQGANGTNVKEPYKRHAFMEKLFK